MGRGLLCQLSRPGLVALVALALVVFGVAACVGRYRVIGDHIVFLDIDNERDEEMNIGYLYDGESMWQPGSPVAAREVERRQIELWGAGVRIQVWNNAGVVVFDQHYWLDPPPPGEVITVTIK